MAKSWHKTPSLSVLAFYNGWKIAIPIAVEMLWLVCRKWVDAHMHK